jgi:hypothetical protein
MEEAFREIAGELFCDVTHVSMFAAQEELQNFSLDDYTVYLLPPCSAGIRLFTNAPQYYVLIRQHNKKIQQRVTVHTVEELKEVLHADKHLFPPLPVLK